MAEIVIKVIKKNGDLQDWDATKILAAIKKSADRASEDLSDAEAEEVVAMVESRVQLTQKAELPVEKIHSFVEQALKQVNPVIAESYMDYRNWRKAREIDQAEIQDEIMQIRYGIRETTNDADGAKGLIANENANTGASKAVAIARAAAIGVYNKHEFMNTRLTREEKKLCDAGYIYIHDMGNRVDGSINCCLFDAATVMKDGFEMGNMWYNEPKGLDSAFDVLGAIISSAAAQQYGGFTVPEVDRLFAYYAEKSFHRYVDEGELYGVNDPEEYALNKVQQDLEAGFQGLEYNLNTVASSRGDYPFTTFSFGLDTSFFGKMVSKTCMKVRMNGQGKKGHKKPVLFPKLVFLYDENIHGEGKEAEDLFEAGVECSSKTMYPDWLSMSGEGYIASMYKEYGKVISPMGCRAFLSPYWKEGGQTKANEWDEPVFVGRFNIGAVSLNLPMILAKAREEERDFFEVLDEMLEVIRKLHQRTYEFLGQQKASTNPLGFTQGGFLYGTLNPDDKIEPLLDYATASFGITALNELQRLYNGKSIAEDGQFALEVMDHINEYVNRIKIEDHHLYAIYGTPAESLCMRQVKQFRTKYGVIKGVSDRDYVSNSFHCHVAEDITPTQKQDLEARFWEKCNGGKIQYVRYPISYNKEAIKSLIRRAMAMGFYEGVNMSLAYCDDCGHEELEMDVCPVCGSKNLTKIDRMNGYLAFSRVHGGTTLNKGKMAEIADRKSM